MNEFVITSGFKRRGGIGDCHLLEDRHKKDRLWYFKGNGTLWKRIDTKRHIGWVRTSKRFSRLVALAVFPHVTL